MWGAAAVAHLCLGTPDATPSAEQVAGALRDLGVDPSGLRLAPEQTWGSQRVHGRARIRGLGRGARSGQCRCPSARQALAVHLVQGLRPDAVADSQRPDRTPGLCPLPRRPLGRASSGSRRRGSGRRPRRRDHRRAEPSRSAAARNGARPAHRRGARRRVDQCRANARGSDRARRSVDRERRPRRRRNDRPRRARRRSTRGDRRAPPPRSSAAARVDGRDRRCGSGTRRRATRARHRRSRRVAGADRADGVDRVGQTSRRKAEGVVEGSTRRGRRAHRCRATEADRAPPLLAQLRVPGRRVRVRYLSPGRTARRRRRDGRHLQGRDLGMGGA